MTDLLEFVSGLLDAFGLVAFALLLGGLAYGLVVLRVSGGLPPQFLPFHASWARVLVFSGWTLICVRLLQLALKYVTLSQVMGEDLFSGFLQTQVFRAGSVSVGLILGLVWALRWVVQRPQHLVGWGVVGVLVCILLVNEARLTHAASRLEDQRELMVITMGHVLAATVWAGGVGHLLVSWWRGRQSSDLTSLWPVLVRRFSPIGIPCMVGLIGFGGFLTWRYVGGLPGLVGTGYGNMVLVKVLFLVLVLVLAALNWSAARRWGLGVEPSPMVLRLSAFVEIEVILGIGLLFTAASLTGYPPSVDVTKDLVTPEEMWVMYNPKIPRVTGPELVLIDAPELTNMKTGEMGKKVDSSWDRFNHNVSGAIVVVMASIAFLHLLGQVGWARGWPLLFVGFSFLIFVFSNPDHWPLGTIGFGESLKSAEVIQHWLAAVVVFGLGWFEWRAREKALSHPFYPFVFPSLCIVGGIILLTHSHSISSLKTEFMTQSTHVAMGFLGVVMGSARWLELRLPSPQNRWAGLASLGSMMLVGLILLFYLNPEFLD